MSRHPHLHPSPARGPRTPRHHPGPPGHPPAHRAASSAFTLIEVILAVSIAVGLLIVAVWFYRQATVYRNQLLLQADELAAIRLVTDQLASDLRAAHDDGRHAFTGDSNSVQFPKTAALPAPAARQSTSLAALTDLRLVSYRTISAMDGTNLVVRGVTRSEEPLVDTLATSQGAAIGTGSSFTTSAAAPWAGDDTNRVATPDIEAIHHLAFRYWDGTAWKDSWNSFTPPAGVEVTLASEPIPFEAGFNSIATASASGTPAAVESPVERFRRVIDIPVGMASVRNRRPSATSEPRDASTERTGP